MSHDLAAIAMHYNPCGFAAPRANFRRFRDLFRGCPLFTAEVSFDGRFHLNADWQIHATSANVMWQKEQLINWMVERLPAAFRKVAWIDADFLFLNPRWAEETSAQLQRFPIVQLFQHFQYTSATGEIERGSPSVGSVLNGRTASGHQAPGGAWAARRDWLQQFGGIYPFNIVGGGDTFLVNALTGQWDCYAQQTSPPKLREHFRTWAGRVYADVRGRVGCIQGDIVHMYHGSRVNRQYTDRIAILRDGDYDPAADVASGWNGLLEWSSRKPDMHRQVQEYFVARKEDEPR